MAAAAADDATADAEEAGSDAVMDENPAVNAEDIDAAPAVAVEALVGKAESLPLISIPSRTDVA